MTEHVPGQLRWGPDEDRVERLRAELEQLEALRTEQIAEGLSGVRYAAGSWRSAAAELDDAVARAKRAGASWQQIADAVGITRQSAWKRWGER